MSKSWTEGIGPGAYKNEALTRASEEWVRRCDEIARKLFWHGQDPFKYITPVTSLMVKPGVAIMADDMAGRFPSLLEDPDLKKTWEEDEEAEDYDEDDDHDYGDRKYGEDGESLLCAAPAPTACTVCGTTHAWIFVDHAATKALVCIGCKDVVPEGWVPCPVTHGHLPFCNLCKDTPRFLPESK